MAGSPEPDFPGEGKIWKSDHGQNILFDIKLVHGFVSRNWLLAGHLLTPEAPLGEPGRQVKGGTCRYEEWNIVPMIPLRTKRKVFEGFNL